MAGGIIGWRFIPGMNNAKAAPLAIPVGPGRRLLPSHCSPPCFSGCRCSIGNVRSRNRAYQCFYRSGSLVFGGGHVVLPLLRQAVVPRGWIGDDPFLAGYGAAQAVPGPLFTFAAYLGAAMKSAPNGWIGGLICLAAIYLPSFLLLIGALPFWDALRHRTAVQSALKGVNATVVGILLGALYTPVWTSAIFAPADFGLGFSPSCFWYLASAALVGGYPRRARRNCARGSSISPIMLTRAFSSKVLIYARAVGICNVAICRQADFRSLRSFGVWLENLERQNRPKRVLWAIVHPSARLSKSRQSGQRIGVPAREARGSQKTGASICYVPSG